MSDEKRGDFFTELLKFAALALVIVIPVRLFVAQPFIVSGASMYPTFQNEQYLVVDELSYRFESPQRGDVIVFRYPKDPSQFFIKRIIGLPGETVSITNEQIYITHNGQTEKLSEPYIADSTGNGPDMSVTLGPDQYFVMGDNRPESSDSRIWGPVPRQNIVGRVIVRLLPLSQASVFPGAHTQ